MNTAPRKKRPDAQSRSRLAPDERERQIVDAAVAFFAEHGLSGQMRDLATRLGITHPLLYRYFPTKDALIARVYEEFYALKWRSDWDALLRDESLELTDRLCAFYEAYVAALDSESWLRIFTFAGLQAEPESRRYMASVRRRVIKPVAEALCRERARQRQDFTLRDLADIEPDADDMDLSWGLHGQMCFIPLRRYVFGSAAPTAQGELLRELIRDFLQGA